MRISFTVSELYHRYEGNVNTLFKINFTLCELTENTGALTSSHPHSIIVIDPQKGGLFSQMEDLEHNKLESLQEVLARNLRLILAERDITQRELAKRTGLAPSTISSYLNCTRYPRADQLDLIASALDIPVYELTDKIVTRSQDEELLLAAYRDLSTRMRELVLDTIEFLVERQAIRSINAQEKRRVIARLASDKKGTE